MWQCCSNAHTDAEEESTLACVDLEVRSQALTLRMSVSFLTKRMNFFSHASTRTFQTALCFTETWVSEAILDNALHLPGFQLFRADSIAELTGKTRNFRFNINESWCSDVTTLNNICCPNLEALFIHCKPFYSPREFSSFILPNVYVPPDVCISAALQQLAEQITEMEQRYPDSLLIILGDFN